VAGAVWRMGFAEISFVRRSTVAQADGFEYVDIFIRIVPTPTRRWKKRWARSPTRFAAARRFTSASRIINRRKRRARRKFCANSGRRASSISRVTACWIAGWNRSCSRTLEAKASAAGFSPLAKGLLTDRYFKGIPADSRGSRPKISPSGRHHRRVAGEDESAERPCANRAVRRWRRWRWHGVAAKA